MKQNILITLIILSLLLAACSGKKATPTAASLVAEAPQATATTAPTEPVSPTAEEPGSVSPEEALAMLQANPWQWVGFTNPMEQYTIDDPQNYQITFNSDGSANIVADCNNAVGSYTSDGSSLSIVVGPMTLAACPEGSHSDNFITYLGSSAIFFFQDGQLFIDLFADGGTMEFAPAAITAAADLTANAWQWERFSGASEQFDVPEPEKYRVNFLQEGSAVLVNADCNIAVGSFSTEEHKLGVELGPTTLAACSPDSLSEQFINYLNTQSIYAVEDGRLTIELPADGGTMEFSLYNPLAGLQAANWQEVLEKTIQACDAPGGVLLADTPQGRFLGASGFASTQDQTPMDPTGQFQIGSNTKSFTTVLSLMLQEDGTWSLDDPLSKWLPDQASKIKDGDKITLRMLGQNHTGIPDYADAVIGEALTAETLDQASLEKGYTPEELVDIAIQLREPNFAPGEGREYSTTNFILLAMAIEAASGKTIDQLYQERIFDPLGMDSTYLLNDVPDSAPSIHGYYTLTGGEAADVSSWNGSQGWSGGSIISTAEDMAKYAAGLASGSVFKDPASLEQLTTFGDGSLGPFNNYGLGVGVWSPEPLAWGHAGQTPGFQSLFAIYPEKDIRLVFFANSGSCNVYSLVPMVNLSPDLFTQELP